MSGARFNGHKIGNGYAEQLGDVYNVAPKAVLAAIAVSFASSGGDELEAARERVLREWWILHENGIVKQRPTLAKPGEEDAGE